jgi:general secretion pathway protein K
MKYHGRRSEAGIAAITAILVVAIAALLAVDLAWQVNLNMRRTEVSLARNQAIQVALGAELLAKAALRRDFEEDSKNKARRDDPEELWNTDITYPVDGGGAVRGKLSGMQGRFNLNNLIRNDKKNQASFDQFVRLLEILGLDPNLAPKVLDWIDPNQQEEFSGAEDNTYTGKTPPYRTANTFFTTTSELLAVDGFLDPENPENNPYDVLERYVAALPPDTRINVNTAEEAVLTSLADAGPISSADPFIRNRPYCGILVGSGTCAAFMDDANNLVTPEFANQFLDVATNYFQLKVLVTLGTHRLTMYSLLYRDETGIVNTRLRYFDTK